MLGGALAEFLGGYFLHFGVELFFEEGEGLVDGEFVNDLTDVVAVLCNGACRLLQTFFVFGIVFVFLFGAGAAKDVFDVIYDLVLGGLDGLDFVKGVVDEFPFQRGDVGLGPVFLYGLGSDVLVVVAGEDPAFEEGLGHGGGEVVEELFAHLVDKEYLALLVVGFVNLGGDGFAEFVEFLDTLSGEDFLEELFVELGRGDVGAAAQLEAHVALEFLGLGVFETEDFLNLGGCEGFGGVEDDGVLSFLADEESGDFGVFYVV